MTKKTILFVSYGGGHATMLAPIIKDLLDNNHTSLNIKVLSLTTARIIYDKYKIPYFEFKDFLSSSDYKSRSYGVELAKKYHNPESGIPYDSSVAYLGLSFADLVERIGEKKAIKEIEKKGLKAFLPLSIMKNIITEIKPDLIVTTNSPRAEAATRKVAHELSIKSLVVTDLMGSSTIPIKATHLSATCKHAYKNYIDATNIDVEHYHILGNPSMDKAIKHLDFNPDIFKKENFTPNLQNKKFILFAEQDCFWVHKKNYTYLTDEERIYYIQKIAEICKSLDMVLLVRPHPSSRPHIFIDWINEFKPSHAIMAHQYDLSSLLHSVDVVMSGFSTVLLEALYSNKPIITLQHRNGGNLLEFDKMGFAFHTFIDDSETLVSYLKSAIFNKDINKQHLDAFYSIFPALPCTPNFTKLIMNIIFKTP